MAVIYEWSGKNSKGMIEKGEVTANSKEDAINQVRKKNIVPTLVKEKEASSLLGKLSMGGGVD
ncbi:MAG: hypothetical protein EPN25_12215, partial [Nitrospirae bacterium]